MGLFGITLEYFPEKSYFRKVNCGYYENDPENHVKYQYAVQKYVKNFTKENPNIDTSDLSGLKNTLPLFTIAPLGLVFFSLKSLTNKVKYVCLFGSVLVTYFGVKNYIYSKNLNYNAFLLKNHHLFDYNMQRTLITGDFRYLRHLVPSDKSLSELKKDKDPLLCFK